MLVKTVQLVSPVAGSVTLGSTSIVGGVRVGYTLSQASRIDPAPFDPVRQPLPYTTGELVTPTRRLGREVVLRGTILAASATDAHAARRRLAEVCGDQRASLIAVRWTPENTLVELGATPVSVAFPRTRGVLVDYELTLFAPDPVAYAVTPVEVTLAAHPGALTTNTGNADVWPEILVTVASGSPEAIRVGNSTTKENLTVAGLTTSVGDELRIISAPGKWEVTLDDVSVMSSRTNTSRFWAIRPGANSLFTTVTAGGGTVTATATFRPGWVD